MLLIQNHYSGPKMTLFVTIIICVVSTAAYSPAFGAPAAVAAPADAPLVGSVPAGCVFAADATAGGERAAVPAAGGALITSAPARTVM